MRSSSVFFVALLSLCAAVAPAQSLLVSQGQVISFSGANNTTTGDLVPSAAGEVFGGTAGYDSAVMSDDGHCLFRAQILQSTGAPYVSPNLYLSRGLYYGDSRGNVIKILRGGDPEPSGTIAGATVQSSTGGVGMGSGYRISSNGLMLFGAAFWDTVGGTITTADNEALYFGTPTGYTMIARKGDVAPGTGGATYSTNFSGISQQGACVNANGHVLFQSSLAGAGVVTANNAALFVGPYNALQLMLRKGDVAPGGEIVSALGFINQMNANGQVAADVSFQAGSGTNPVTVANDKALWIYTPGSGLAQLVREGDAAPIAGTFYGNATNSWSPAAGATCFNASAQVMLRADLTGAVTAGADDMAIFLLSASGNQVVFRRGDAAPGVPGANLQTSNDSSMCLSDSGRVAFQCSMFQTGSVTSANDTGIWTGTPGNLVLVAREGDVAPGTGGLTFGNTSGQFMIMNGAGQILFNNSLVGTGGGSSHWAWDPVLGLMAVRLPNDPIQVAPSLTHTAFVQGGMQFTNGDTRPLSFANDGTATMRVGFNEGSSAIMTVRIGSLTGTPGKISEATGATHNLYLNAGLGGAGLNYVVAGSTSTTPGTTIGAITVPLNIDAYTQFTLANINVLPYVNTAGTLNSVGRAQAQIVIPPLPGFAGVVVYHAYGVLDAFNQLVFASEPARLEIIP
jgi:hypothetical protein